MKCRKHGINLTVGEETTVACVFVDSTLLSICNKIMDFFNVAVQHNTTLPQNRVGQSLTWPDITKEAGLNKTRGRIKAEVLGG